MGAWALLPGKVLFGGLSSDLPEYNNWTWHVTGAADRSRFTRAAVLCAAQVFASVFASCSAAPCFSGWGGEEGIPHTCCCQKRGGGWRFLPPD